MIALHFAILTVVGFTGDGVSINQSNMASGRCDSILHVEVLEKPNCPCVGDARIRDAIFDWE